MPRDEEDQEPLLAGHSQDPFYGANGISGTGSINNGDIAVDTETDVWPQIVQPKKKNNVPVGTLDLISTKFESLDYDICENQLLLDEERSDGLVLLVKKSLMRWIIFFFIGILTAAIAACIDIAIDKISAPKYALVKYYVDQCVTKDCLYVPYFVWIGLNIVFLSIGSFLVAYIEPIAGGSGIPQIKCYLNGIRMPRVVRIKTLLVKVVGVISTVVGGLAAGKEGPMIHTGAVVAAGVSQGKSTTFGFDFGIFHYFREDHEKRDFVSGGAAAGVAAAFGSPVGGVLFSLEEGCSFWNQSFTWRIFFASSVSYFTLNLLLSAYHGHPGNLTYNGLLNFGHFESINYEIFELVIFAFLGAIGGCLGALYNHFNYLLTVFRMRYITKRWLRVVEACLVGVMSVTAAMIMTVTISDCKPLGKDPNPYPIQMYCSDGYYSAAASLWLQNPEVTVRSLFHDEAGSQSMLTLLVFSIFYLTLAIWTYGLSVSGGVFIPCLCLGAAWGRLAGIVLSYIFPGASWVDPGKYALVGAAAQLGGVVRMTISLTVILIEATGNISFGLPLMITLLVAKWVGDYFSEGLYDIHIQLQGVPFLPWDAPPMSSVISTGEVMNAPVLTLSTVETVRNIVDALGTTYNGFPVVDRPTDWQMIEKKPDEPAGKLRGLILSWHLIVLLEKKAYLKHSCDRITMNTFRNKYPRYKGIKEILVPEEVMEQKIDLRPFMNPFPYTVQKITSLPKVFTLFRALGLRHLVVVNDSNEVVGMVTRKDLARYKVTKHQGVLGIEEVMISNAL